VVGGRRGARPGAREIGRDAEHQARSRAHDASTADTAAERSVPGATAPIDRNGGGVVEPAARFNGPAPASEAVRGNAGTTVADERPSSRHPPDSSGRQPRSRPPARAEEPVSDDAQLFARWEKDALAPEEDDGQDLGDEDGDEIDILARTPEQEARRTWALRIMALFVGFFAVVGLFALWTRSKPDQGTTASSASAAVLIPAPTAKTTASAAPAPAPAASEIVTPPPAPRRLPVVDIEVPDAPDPATEQAWEWASQGLTANDFKVADKAFAELGKRNDAPTRETARLARALWWINNGKQAEVAPVIADLAANATTPSVRRRARELLKH
jgi:hypothetical protein